MPASNLHAQGGPRDMIRRLTGERFVSEIRWDRLACPHRGPEERT
jgi:hypothetical protein